MVEQIRIMSYNIWVDGTYGGQPLEQTVAVIRQGRADIVGMQEVLNNTKQLAEMLGWHHLQQAWDTAVLSRYPIEETTPFETGVRIRLDDGRAMYLINVHMAHAPYQPYQLLGIPYADAPFLKTEEEAIAAAEAARGDEVSLILQDLNELPEGATVFVTGDFNEPSHLDWTDAAFIADRQPMKVAFPTARRLVGAGLRDAYRRLYPDEVDAPGFTWPTLEAAQRTDKPDRIDFILFQGAGVEVESFHIIGGDPRHSDVVVRPYPSDHRAVVATFSLPAAP